MESISIATELYIYIRWWFEIVPVSVVLATVLFLVVVMAATRRSQTKLWKSSALAMLFHRLDHETRAMSDAEDDLEQKKKQAHGVRVRLQRNGPGGTLLWASKTEGPALYSELHDRRAEIKN